jgi:hypothetical protein
LHEVARASAEAFSLTIKADSSLARRELLEAIGCAKAAAAQLQGQAERLEQIAAQIAEEMKEKQYA